MNSFVNLILVNKHTLTKLTCLRKVFILYVSHSSTFLPSYVNTYIIFQPFGEIQLLNTSDVYLFTIGCFCHMKYHFIHLSVKSLLWKIEEIRFIVKAANAAIIAICESKLDASLLDPEISIDYYKILPCERNRRGEGVALSAFPSEIEKIFFDIWLLH